LVNVEYPFGFVFKEASPKTFYGNNVWQFSNLNPGEKKNISIKGNIIGQDNEEKVFKINVGTANENDERDGRELYSSWTLSAISNCFG